ncbi:MAG: hypothetical protein HZA92_05735 [Verrucomicrobia bacterium]|nr:hypothetical protein [Verrucomicrobiota bacterium]
MILETAVNAKAWRDAAATQLARLDAPNPTGRSHSADPSKPELQNGMRAKVRKERKAKFLTGKRVGWAMLKRFHLPGEVGSEAPSRITLRSRFFAGFASIFNHRVWDEIHLPSSVSSVA